MPLADPNIPIVPNRIRLSLIEDDTETGKIIGGWLKQTPDFEFLGGFCRPTGAIPEILRVKPDVVLVDINLPEMTGVEVVRRLKPQLPAAQFVMLTIYGDVDHIYEALAAGASGYLLKSTMREQLIAAIREVFDGGSPMTSDVARKVVQSFRRPVTAPLPPGEIAELSERERAVLDLLATGYLYKEIADRLSIKVSTVDTYIRRIYEKLHVRSRAQAVAKYLHAPGELTP